jgi:uncharacterized protein
VLAAVLLEEENYRLQPWKNGRGETREIGVDTLDPFRWRVSLATLSQSGPFSLFPGYDRCIVNLGSQPVHLQHAKQEAKRLDPFSPLSFRGDEETHADIKAPGLDFGLLTHREKARGKIYSSKAGANEQLQFPLPGNEHFLFCCQGEWEVFDPHSEKSWNLKRGECLWMTRRGAEEYLNIRAEGRSETNRCLWTVIHVFSS